MIAAIAGSTSWTSWVVNLLIAEWWIQYRRPGGRTAGDTPARARG
ncbi:hypothetical protein [Allosalinactinospora lopnorensis]|nr:hypothetical protein [Allosalinactinospora lopnorensis]